MNVTAIEYSASSFAGRFFIEIFVDIPHASMYRHTERIQV